MALLCDQGSTQGTGELGILMMANNHTEFLRKQMSQYFGSGDAASEDDLIP
jgi:hypothetical protein